MALHRLSRNTLLALMVLGFAGTALAAVQNRAQQ